MNNKTDATFVGLGFGAIQAGLFVFEAIKSGRFGRIVVADVVPDLVAGIQQTGGHYGLNIAHLDRIEALTVGPIEIYNPQVPAEREILVEAIAEATELATALPSVRYFRTDDEASAHRLLLRGLQTRPQVPRLVYTAENDLTAAEKLAAALFDDESVAGDSGLRERTCIVNTVIGKMSGVVDDFSHRGVQLSPIAPGISRANLVESFSRILISPVHLPAGLQFERGIDVFVEKPSLVPFEEAKLYGHNATHALAGYLAAARGLERMDEVQDLNGCVEFLGAAFREESGAALVKKWADVDALFTPAGFADYVDDLLLRMLNPYLGDRVARITRDPERKLSWNDRLVGVMRLAREHGIVPKRFALGATAALYALAPAVLNEPTTADPLLKQLWEPDQPDATEQNAILELIQNALPRLKRWLEDDISPFD